jgi:hypothetical protein
MNLYKLTFIPTLLCGFLPIFAFSQWTIKKVDNGFDEPYKIAYSATNNGAILKLEPVKVEVSIPKKYPEETGMYVFETTNEHSIVGGAKVDLTTGLLSNMQKVYSGELVVIAGQSSLDSNGISKKYFLIFDGSNQLICNQNRFDFFVPKNIGSFNISSQKSIDSLIQIARGVYDKSKIVPQLYESQTQIAFYLSGGYHCDDEIPVDISFLIGGEYKKYNVLGTKSENSTIVFLVDDLMNDTMKVDFLKASSVKLRFNESHCESDYYEFKMTGSTAALNFVSKP